MLFLNNPESGILTIFCILRILQYVAEQLLATMNLNYINDASNQTRAKTQLAISDTEWAKTIAYTRDKFHFQTISRALNTIVNLGFLVLGGLGLVEGFALSIAPHISFLSQPISTGLVFMGLLSLLALIFGLPFELYFTFVVEQKHGFNRQTLKGFFVDKLKGLALTLILGAPLLAGILAIMNWNPQQWWFLGWIVFSVFSLFVAWLYPTVLAPLFNKFSPLADETLIQAIKKLCDKVGFSAAGVFVMNASIRSSHGNAYFTGVFGAKRIVLFDTLVASQTPSEVVAVLAHELGHFKLHHVRWGVIRGILFTGFTLWLMNTLQPLQKFYVAFGLQGASNYGALLVFSLWFSLIDFFIGPLSSELSRRNEFAADDFAKQVLGHGNDLKSALLKLREKSAAMPLAHPLYSRIYYSHPPLLERIAALVRS